MTKDEIKKYKREWAKKTRDNRALIEGRIPGRVGFPKGAKRSEEDLAKRKRKDEENDTPGI
jgi:hypothetical protein